MTEPDALERQRWFDAPGLRRFLGQVLIGGYFRLVRATSRLVLDPPDFWEKVQKDGPAILATWHGQSWLAFIIIPEPHKVAVLASKHPDGFMMGEAARSLGFHIIPGSGASKRQPKGTGGAVAYRNLMRALEDGRSLYTSADIPPEPGREVSTALISLARRTGRPFFAVASSSNRRTVMERVWDKMQFNYPFSTMVFVCHGPFYVNDPETSDEAYAAKLAEALDAALARALDIADGKVRPEAPQ